LQVSGQLLATAVLSLEKDPPCTLCIGEWMGPREGKGKKTNSVEESGKIGIETKEK
jgi:hypothetical protein